MPSVNDDIRRHARVRISYHGLDGNPRTEESDGLRAVRHQHDIDQLNDLFWIQRLSRLKRERLIKRFEKVSRSKRVGLQERAIDFLRAGRQNAMQTYGVGHARLSL